ncbi:hypothetical protein BC829DRAFT_441851 [Chytridium lagenaria]|nr:hypothetical protein BC829DRAFT_441851 [Chytridium lagenaria]
MSSSSQMKQWQDVDTREKGLPPSASSDINGIPYTDASPLTSTASPISGQPMDPIQSKRSRQPKSFFAGGSRSVKFASLGSEGWKRTVSKFYDPVSKTSKTDGEGGKKGGKGCCCVPRRPLYRIVCGVVVLILLGVLGRVGANGAFNARFPSIKVLSVEIGNGRAGAANAGVSFSLPQGSTNLNNVTVKFNLRLNISCWNANAYNLKIDLIDLDTFLAVNQTALARAPSPLTLGSLTAIVPPVRPDPNYRPNFSPKVGTGNRTIIQFPSRKNVTFAMNLVVEYTPDPNTGLSGIQRLPSSSMSAVFWVAILERFGYRPSISDTITINCPIAPDEITAVLTSNFGGVVNGTAPAGTGGGPRGSGGTAGGVGVPVLPVAEETTLEDVEDTIDLLNAVFSNTTARRIPLL